MLPSQNYVPPVTQKKENVLFDLRVSTHTLNAKKTKQKHSIITIQLTINYESTSPLHSATLASALNPDVTKVPLLTLKFSFSFAYP